MSEARDPFAEIRDDLLRCNKCGNCAAACPTYATLRRETMSSRGRVSLIDAYLAGEVPASKELHELLYMCLSCHACVPTCPNGVRVDKLVLAARERMARRDGGSAVRKAIFDGLLPRPGLLDAALWPARIYAASGIKHLAERLGIVHHLPGALGIYGQMVPEVPLRSGMSYVGGSSRARGERRGKVGYFLGCAQNLGYPDTARATVGLLNLAGYDVLTPTELVCCGMPALAYGETDAARELAARNLAAFAEADLDAIITDCASCGSFLKEYGELLRESAGLREAAERFARLTVDVSEFLAEAPIDAAPSSLGPLRVTYHDPCHLGHAQGVKSQPRDLLRRIPDLTLVEMRTPGLCCGSAGSYALTHPEVSVQILDRRISEAAETEATLLATGCPACQIQLGFGARRAGLDVSVRHPVELLAAAYGLETSMAKRLIPAR